MNIGETNFEQHGGYDVRFRLLVLVFLPMFFSLMREIKCDVLLWQFCRVCLWSN